MSVWPTRLCANMERAVCRCAHGELSICRSRNSTSIDSLIALSQLTGREDRFDWGPF
jgi:hypothetical protein